jgi:hypothetical protein
MHAYAVNAFVEIFGHANLPICMSVFTGVGCRAFLQAKKNPPQRVFSGAGYQTLKRKSLGSGLMKPGFGCYQAGCVPAFKPAFEDAYGFVISPEWCPMSRRITFKVDPW